MANCPNCNSVITCGCQKRKASNNAEVCSKCIDAYQKQLNDVNTTTLPSTDNTEATTVLQSSN